MRRIILASGSPRRQELLGHMGIDFESIPSRFDEWLDDAKDVEQIAKELALGKALDIAKSHPEALVIGCDTIVTLHDKQLGKQPDRATAKELLRRMSGQRVEVISSLAIVCAATGKRDVRVAYAAIAYAPYDDTVIDQFLDANEWQYKAGATSIQSKTTPPVDRIIGDYDTVLGMSTSLLCDMLRDQGVTATPYRPLLPHSQKPLA